MRPPYALVATLGLVLLAAPASAWSASPALASPAADPADVCMPSPCEAVNRVCRKVFDVDCVALDSGATAAAAEDCMGPVCDAINRVCERVGGASCLGTAATATTSAPIGAGTLPARCTGLPCDVVNLLCTVVRGGPCVR